MVEAVSCRFLGPGIKFVATSTCCLLEYLLCKKVQTFLFKSPPGVELKSQVYSLSLPVTGSTNVLTIMCYPSVSHLGSRYSISSQVLSNETQVTREAPSCQFLTRLQFCQHNFFKPKTLQRFLI